MNTPENNLLVTVIVPVYNAARWLPELFGSLQSQTYGDMEVILVDDGSTDDSPRLCREVAAADKRFRVVTRPNGGLSAARNTGLEYVRGHWLMFVDADDMLQPGAIARLLETATDTGADIVVGAMVYAERMPPPSPRKSPRVMPPVEAIETSLYQQPPMNSACGVLYRSLLFEGGPRFSEGKYYEDLDFFYRIFERASTIAYLPEELYFYRRHQSSFINTLTPARFDVLGVTDDLERYYRGTTLAAAARDRRFSAYYNILLLILRSGHQAPEILGRCLEVVKQGRREALRNPRVRLKNKAGALLSYGGVPLLRLFSKLF